MKKIIIITIIGLFILGVYKISNSDYSNPTTEELQLRQLEKINDNLKDILYQIGRINDKIK